jgi:hypothetical protein
MKTIFTVLIFVLPFISKGQDTLSYNYGRPVLIETLADISDSLQKAGSEWRIATQQDLEKIQLAAVGKVANKALGFQGVYWVGPVKREKHPMFGNIIDANYCFINNKIFKVFAPSGGSASILFIK